MHTDKMMNNVDKNFIYVIFYFTWIFPLLSLTWSTIFFVHFKHCTTNVKLYMIYMYVHIYFSSHVLFSPSANWGDYEIVPCFLFKYLGVFFYQDLWYSKKKYFPIEFSPIAISVFLLENFETLSQNFVVWYYWSSIEDDWFLDVDKKKSIAILHTKGNSCNFLSLFFIFFLL